MPEIKLQLLNELKKQGRLLTIFRCERCYKKIPFYSTNNNLINMIYLSWVRDHRYCNSCEKKIKNLNIKPKKKIKPRINTLLEKYELKIIDIEKEF